MKFKIFILIISMFFCYVMTSQSFAQKAKEKSIEKVEEGTSSNIITKINTLLSSTAGKIVGSVLSILIVYLLLNILFKRLLIPRFSKSNFKRYIPILKILFWVIAIGLILIFILKPIPQAIIAIGIAFLVAIGFASQDFLKNIFAGVLILFDKQIQVGDTIQIDTYIGEICQIGLKNIKLLTPDKLQVTIPNSEFVKQTKSISDSKESYAQVITELYLPAKIDAVKVKTIADRAAMTSRYIYLNQPIETIIKNEIHQNQSIIKLILKAYVLNKKYESKFSSELTEIIMDELVKQKIISPQELSFH